MEPVLFINELQEYLSTFIPQWCCYTNNCCFNIEWKDLVDLGNMKFKIIASDQEIEAKFSPDGKIWRCACDMVNGAWTVFPEAYTRCLFIPRLGS